MKVLNRTRAELNRGVTFASPHRGLPDAGTIGNIHWLSYGAISGEVSMKVAVEGKCRLLLLGQELE
jgi:hypothetical protein